jgi:hypothetical protein
MQHKPSMAPARRVKYAPGPGLALGTLTGWPVLA